MTMTESPNPISAGEQEQLLQELAQSVRMRRLEVPAIFLLEMCKPLSSLAHSVGVMSAPLLYALFGAQNGQKLLSLLESRTSIEQLICLLERGAVKQG